MSDRATTAIRRQADTVDLDEYGVPVRDEYRRLGACRREEGMFVRFEPGFGLNVHIGHRWRATAHAVNPGSFIEKEFGAMGIDGWERLCELVDEWRERRATPCGSNETGDT